MKTHSRTSSENNTRLKNKNLPLLRGMFIAPPFLQKSNSGWHYSAEIDQISEIDALKRSGQNKCNNNCE